MANSSSYPNSIDTDLELPRADAGVTEINGDVVNSIRDAVIAIEQTLGTNPQGNTSSVSSRLSRALDINGNIKASALSSIGLVTLPILNSHIGNTASISESKLSLDYTTAFLKARIDSTNVDLSALTSSFNGFTNDVLKHYNGSLNRHDGYDVDLLSSVRGETDVESVLHLLDIYSQNTNSSLLDTIASVSVIESTVDSLVAQGNLTEEHQEGFHGNYIKLQKKGGVGEQGNQSIAAFATTIFKTNTGIASNAVQVMRPNVSRVTGLIPKLSELVFGSKDQLRIQAGGMGLSTLDVDLGSLIPVTNLDDIVEKINEDARSASNHYPISAYNVGGRLVIAHNLQGEAFTIAIQSTISDTAHDVLGFSDVADTTITWADGYHGANIGGKNITDMKPLLRMRYTHVAPLDEISPAVGDLLQLFNIDTAEEARIICNIYGHDTDSASNGTYYISDIIGSGNKTIQLNTSIVAGEFNLDIVADAINFDNGSSARGEIYDIFVDAVLEDGYDGYCAVTKSLRAEYLTNSGVVIRALSKDFPTANMEWEITNNDTVRLIEDGDAGESVLIPTNFRGQLNVRAPDNINAALMEVIGNPSPSAAQAISPISSFAGSGTRLHVASAHFAGDYGNNVVKFITDRRIVSDSVDDIYFDIQNTGNTEDTFNEVRNNGVIRGFDVISNTTTTIKVRGGRVLANGKIVNVATQDVTIDSFTGATRLLTLDYNGMYKAFDSDEPGFSIGELTSGDAYGDHLRVIPIVEFGTTGSALDGTFTDRRLIVSNIDKRLRDVQSSFEAQLGNLESSLSGSLMGYSNVASTDFTAAYISSTLATNTLTQTGVFNPFGTTYGGSIVDYKDKNITRTTTSGRVTFDHPGTYMVSYAMFLEHSVDADLDAFKVVQNGSIDLWSAQTRVTSTVDPVERSIVFISDFSAGDYIDVQINSSGANTLRAMAGSTLNIVKIDGYDSSVAKITSSANLGFSNLDDAGFVSGTDTTRRFDLLSVIKESEFKAKGMTHVNVMMELEYTDESGSNPFGTSGDVDIDIGVAITTGRINDTTVEQYVTARTANSINMPDNSITEQYVASIPLSSFSNIRDNIIFDIKSRIRIVGSTYVDGGTGGGSQPMIIFNRVRIVTSSYSIAGDILNLDGSSESLSAKVNDNL